MNDPHVVALVYIVECDAGFDYGMADAIDFETSEFSARVADSVVRFQFEPHMHFATVPEARASIEPFVSAWQIKTEIRHGQGAFRLRYDPSRVEIVDRNPSPMLEMRINMGMSAFATAGFDVLIKTSFVRFPRPPLDFSLSDELQAAYGLWKAASYNPHFITTIGYLLLTLLEDPPPGANKWDRKKAGKRYGVDYAVLSELGRLTTTKGGHYARKRDGINNPLTAEEHTWLENVIRLLMYRMGEHNYASASALPLITVSNVNAMVQALVVP